MVLIACRSGTLWHTLAHVLSLLLLLLLPAPAAQLTPFRFSRRLACGLLVNVGQWGVRAQAVHASCLAGAAGACWCALRRQLLSLE